MDKTVKALQKQPQGDQPPAPQLEDRNDTSSERFRAECEARYVLKQPLADRRKYLDGVEKNRGVGARAYLEDFIRIEWAKKKAPKKGG